MSASDDHAEGKRWANWWRIAFSRDPDPVIRRQARRVVLCLETGYLVLAVALYFILPSLSWFGVALLWVGGVLFAATLLWVISHD